MIREKVYIVSGIIKFLGLLFGGITPIIISMITGSWWFLFLLAPTMIMFGGGASAIAEDIENNYEVSIEKDRKYIPYYSNGKN